jgi:hypothetical protein
VWNLQKKHFDYGFSARAIWECANTLPPPSRKQLYIIMIRIFLPPQQLTALGLSDEKLAMWLSGEALIFPRKLAVALAYTIWAYLDYYLTNIKPHRYYEQRPSIKGKKD